MTSKPLVSGNLFRTNLFKGAFEDLFSINGAENSTLDEGIITYILKNHAITPAKGGTTQTLSEWSDTTYFSHVINGMAIAGRLLEKKIEKSPTKETDERELEAYVRLFFAGVSLHDADKLFKEGYSGAITLDTVLENHKQEIIKICSHYLVKLGNADTWWNDLSYIILRTENRTMEMANQLNTTREKTLLSEISEYTKLADQAGGIKAHDSDNTFFKIKELLKKFGEETDMLRVSKMPQSLLMAKLLKTARQNILESRYVVAETPNGIIYSGGKLTENEILKIKDDFIKDAENLGNAVDGVLENYAPSNNSIRLEFAKDVVPTLETVKAYVEKFNNGLLLWSGKEWKKTHSDFDIRARKLGIPLSSRKKGDDISFYMDLPEKSEELEDTENMSKRTLGLIACARRVYYQCFGNKMPEHTEELDFLQKNFGEDIRASADNIQMKTLLAISYASKFHNSGYEDILEGYMSTLRALSEELMRMFPTQQRPDYDAFFEDAMGTLRNQKIPDIPDKSKTCIQCGMSGDLPLKDQYAFGYKATAGGGLKISVLKYDENKFNGKICLMCARENSMRKSEIGKESGALCVRINLADYIVPLNPNRLFESFEKMPNDGKGYTIGYGDDGESAVIYLNKRSKKQLDYHTVMFISKPNKTKEEFYVLYGLIKLALNRGLKIKLSPLFSSEDMFLPMFAWDNAPYWVRNLSFSEVRIDRMPDVKKELDLIYSVGKLNPGYEGVLNFIIENMTRSRVGLLNAAWRNMLSDGTDRLADRMKRIEKGVKWYMEKYGNELKTSVMQEIVNEACGIVSEAPKSGNDHTWMIRKALDVYARNLKQDDGEIENIISGRIWEIANRDKYARKDIIDHANKFSKLLVELLREKFGARFPEPEYKKDIIAQFALMYNMTKWKSVKKNSGDEKNE